MFVSPSVMGTSLFSMSRCPLSSAYFYYFFESEFPIDLFKDSEIRYDDQITDSIQRLYIIIYLHHVQLQSHHKRPLEMIHELNQVKYKVIDLNFFLPQELLQRFFFFLFAERYNQFLVVFNPSVTFLSIRFLSPDLTQHFNYVPACCVRVYRSFKPGARSGGAASPAQCGISPQRGRRTEKGSGTQGEGEAPIQLTGGGV